MNDYEQKLEEKRERLLKAAQKARQEAEERFRRADEISSLIQPGQPILVGHYSEKRHRRDLKRIDDYTRKGLEALKRAEELERRADRVGKGGISSDDPDALNKIADKAERLEAVIETAKAVNKAWRTAGRPAGDEFLRWIRTQDIPDDLRKEALRNVAYSWDKAPFPTFWLRNRRAEIRRLRERANELQTLDNITFSAHGDGWSAATEENRIRFYFNHKPDDETRRLLKSYGFKWAPSIGAWQRKLTVNAIEAANHVVVKLGGNEK